jgi:hypothetical protein
MPTIITASELRAVLGVSSSLYSDAVLNDCIDAAEIVILPMLTTFSVPIQSVKLTDNIATIYTTLPHEFTEGSSVVIAGCGSPFNGTRIVNAQNVNVIPFDGTTLYETGDAQFEFTCNITNADVLFKNIIPAGTATLTNAANYVGNPAVEQATLAVSVEVFTSRNQAGGQMEGVDFTNVSPYRLGRSLFNRVSGLLGSYIDVESIAQ